MANYTDLHIVFKGENDSLQEALAFIKDESFCLFSANDIEIEDDILTIDGEAKWSTEIDEVAENICGRYKISANGYESEPGCNFFTKFSIDEDGTFSKNDFNYICAPSIEVYGDDYFIERGDCGYIDDPEGAIAYLESLEAVENFQTLTEDERLEILCSYIAVEKKEKEEIEEIENLFNSLPKIGTTTGDILDSIQVDENLQIVEAEKTKDGYKTLAYNTKERLWLEKEYCDIELHGIDMNVLSEKRLLIS